MGSTPAYDAGRDFTEKSFRSGCYAPFTSMFLDPHGNVLACCQNTEYPLGNVTTSSLLDIWQDAPAQQLRRALRDYDLTHGCGTCSWQLAHGAWASTLAASFDDMVATDADPKWPRRLEFSVSNTCNLECAMCNGDWSSMIRSRREGRPPLPKVYDDHFFEQLRPFLAHLDSAKFLGGEPFVASESLRVMDLMIDEGHEIACSVQTNGTQWTPRVRRILDGLPVSLTVSLDGVTRETIERIRVGASYDVLMSNLDHYREYTARKGTELELAFCFMVQNWQEFGEFLRFADDLGATVSVVTVVHPSFSPYQLPLEDFATMLHTLEAQDMEMRGRLRRNRDVWTAELHRLRTWYRNQHLTREPEAAVVGGGGRPVDPPTRRTYVSSGPLPPALRVARPDVTFSDPRDLLTQVGDGLVVEQTAVARCDGDGTVVALGLDALAPADSFLGIAATDCVGHPWDELVGRLGRRHGPEVAVFREAVVPEGWLQFVTFGRPGRGATYLQVLTTPEHRGAAFAGSVTVASCSTTPPHWAPVRVT